MLGASARKGVDLTAKTPPEKTSIPAQLGPIGADIPQAIEVAARGPLGAARDKARAGERSRHGNPRLPCGTGRKGPVDRHACYIGPVTRPAPFFFAYFWFSPRQAAGEAIARS